MNEQTGIVFSVYVPLDKETDMKLKIPSANYDMNGYIRCNVSYTVGGTMSNGYSVWGLYASAEEREILKYLNGAEYAGDQEYTYERIQNANGVVMGRTGRIAGGKVQYCAIGPVFEDGSRVIMKATLTVAPEDTDAAWFREICDAFERTVCLTAGAAAETPAPTAEPAPAVTAAPAAGPSPVPTEAPTPAPTAEPVPVSTPKLMDESGVYFDRTYEAKTYVMGRNSMDASMLGVYEVLFREDGTCDFTMGGTPMKGLSWQKRNGSFVVDYYGMEITFMPSAEGINMDYFGTGILKMELK
ncbi:MAG: hypothetical protein CW338_09320 [Clostridiales bacterium]|nr:hypothetical protein [Clostridiales bacterium]